jgi:hypothetical protein
MRRFKLALLIACLSFCASLSGSALLDKRNNFLDLLPPTIQFVSPPKGLGLTRKSVTFAVSDQSKVEVSAVLVQGLKRIDLRPQIWREDLDNNVTYKMELPLAGEGLIDGLASVVVQCKDISAWHNSSSESFSLIVDGTPPIVKERYLPRIVRVGGTSLLFYAVKERNLSDSGVRLAGKLIFRGYPARGLFRELAGPQMSDPSIYVALVSVPEKSGLSNYGGETGFTIYAEDEVGNNSTRDIKIATSPTQFRDIISTDESNIKKITLELNDLASKALRHSRGERYWQGPFFQQKNEASSPLLLRFGNRSEGGSIIEWSTFSLPFEEREIVAAERGIISKVEKSEILGTVVIIDHGIGVHSLYFNLEGAILSPGKLVEKGEVIGVGRVNEAGQREFGFQMLISGIPVNPQDWWSKDGVERDFRSLAGR